MNHACPAVLNLKGEHFPCDWPVDEFGRHPGWAHANEDAEAIWCGDEGPSNKAAESDTWPDEEVPFIAVGHGEDPPWGDNRDCPECGEPDLPLEDSDPPGLRFISHCGKSWIRGHAAAVLVLPATVWESAGKVSSFPTSQPPGKSSWRAYNTDPAPRS